MRKHVKAKWRGRCLSASGDKELRYRHWCRISRGTSSPYPASRLVSHPRSCLNISTNVERSCLDNPIRWATAKWSMPSTPQRDVLREIVRADPRFVEENVSDELLLKNVAEGDKAAMHVMFIRHREKVFRFIQRIVRNPAIADDLVSQVFLAVWQSANRFQNRSRVLPGSLDCPFQGVELFARAKRVCAR